MSPLGQFPNFLTDGSRIRRPPVDDTKNPIFRLAPSYIKEFPISGIWPQSRIRLPRLVFIYPGLCCIFVTLPSFLSRYLSDRKLLLPFPFPTSAFPAIVRHFLPSIFRAGFQRKLPVLFYVQHFSPLSVSLFSHLPPFPGSTIFSARRLCRLSPVITYFYSSPAPRSGLPSRFSPASDETAPSQPSFPSAFPQHLPTILKFCYLHTRHGKWFYPAWR